jgi:hypothetical protein
MGNAEEKDQDQPESDQREQAAHTAADHPTETPTKTKPKALFDRIRDPRPIKWQRVSRSRLREPSPTGWAERRTGADSPSARTTAIPATCHPSPF